MKAFVTAKVQMFLVISSILAVWMLLPPPPAQAHETALRAPTCSNLPTAEGFFTDAATAAIVPNTPAPAGLAPVVGTGIAANGGYNYLRYAKITVPQLAAGELRVFDAITGTHVSDAILCRPGADVTSRTSYSAHNAAENAAVAADRAATTANISESAARSALRSAANALTAAARALTAAGNTTAATAATADASAARTVADATANQNESEEVTALQTAVTDLRTARDAFHARFQIRTEVNPGDEEYVLVIAATDGTPTPAVQFHGALAAVATGRQGTLNAGDQHTYAITVTAPGLLTVETTGSTDTSGMLSPTPTAEDDSSGSRDNFKIVAPVTAISYTVTVDGQTPTTTGAYTLDMDFKVAMQTGLPTTTGVTVPTNPSWTGTGIAADDDEPLQIQGSADEDYFLLTIDDNSSGFLTIEATDGTTSATDAATTGTFYGPTGELATDTNSGADASHFRIRAPVQEGVSYLVKVTGTTGVYQLSVALDQAEGDALLAVPGTQPAPSLGCNDETAGEICQPDQGESLETERYAFDLMESGALYLHTTGSIDTVGTLYGPDGSQIATDDNSGADNNFRIAANVNAGLHLLEVRGKTRTTEGVYALVANFVTGAEVDEPARPPTGTPPPAAPDADSTGELEEPANGSTRSGIGLVRGWVCQDGGAGVEIRIMDADGDEVAEFIAPYGSERDDVDVVDVCDGQRSTDVGFATQFNYNLLPAGTYTVEAFVDGDQIGRASDQTNTFTVVRIGREFEQRLPRARTRVENFPRTGQTTILEWDQASQNFQIVDFE